MRTNHELLSCTHTQSNYLETSRTACEDSYSGNQPNTGARIPQNAKKIHHLKFYGLEFFKV